MEATSSSRPFFNKTEQRSKPLDSVQGIKEIAVTNYVPPKEYTVSPPPLTCNKNSILLDDVYPLDESQKQHCNFTIILFFIDFYSEKKPSLKTRITNFFTRNVELANNPYYIHVNKMFKKEIFDHHTGLIKSEIVNKLATKHYYIPIARAAVLLRECAHILKYMPNSYKASLLKDFSKDEKTEGNLKIAFNLEMKKSYKNFMITLDESQKKYDLSHKNDSLNGEVASQIINFTSKIKQNIKDRTIKKVDEIYSKKNISKIEYHINKLSDIIAENSDEDITFKKYNKFRKKMKKITQDKYCLDKIIQSEKTYKICYAVKWGNLELEIVEIQKELISMIENANSICQVIDDSTNFSNLKNIENSLQKILKENESAFEMYIDKLQEIHDKLKNKLHIIHALLRESKIPDKLYKEIIKGNIISIKEINKIIKSLSFSIEQVRKQIIAGMAQCSKVVN
jgi:hypothetical protein